MVRLLETYEEARLLFEAKGWGLAKAAEHLSELPDMARFHLNPTKLSQISKAGANRRIEPEVAAAVEGMETRHGYERQMEIVTRGLLALHGDPPSEEMERLAAELRERLAASEHALKLVEALEEKAGKRLTSLGQKLAEKSASELAPKLVDAVEALGEKASQRATQFFQTLAERFGRVFWTRIAVTAASGALVGCLAVLVAPLLAGAAQPGPLVLVLPGAGPDGSTVSFDPRSLFDNMPAMWGEKPLDQPIPVKTLPGQMVAPCHTEIGQVEINGNCWFASADVKPPCGLLFRHGDKCYAPVAEPKKPAP